MGVVLGALTFFAWLVGYLVWDGLQWEDLVKSIIAAAVFMTIWLLLLVRLKRQRRGIAAATKTSPRFQGVSLKLSQYQPRYCMASENFSKLAGLAT